MRTSVASKSSMSSPEIDHVDVSCWRTFAPRWGKRDRPPFAKASLAQRGSAASSPRSSRPYPVEKSPVRPLPSFICFPSSSSVAHQPHARCFTCSPVSSLRHHVSLTLHFVCCSSCGSTCSSPLLIVIGLISRDKMWPPTPALPTFLCRRLFRHTLAPCTIMICLIGGTRHEPLIGQGLTQSIPLHLFRHGQS